MTKRITIERIENGWIVEDTDHHRRWWEQNAAAMVARVMQLTGVTPGSAADATTGRAFDGKPPQPAQGERVKLDRADLRKHGFMD